MKEALTNSDTTIKSRGYSLWLMPSGEAYDKFSNLIQRLASENGAPLFEPHVTLFGGVTQSEKDVVAKTQQLVTGQSPFAVTLETVDGQDFYFRTLFVRAARTPLLQAVHDRAKQLFEMQDAPDYMPHLSLMYGNFPIVLKEKIIQSIGRDQTAQFVVDRVHLFKTDGEVDAWQRIKVFPFK